MALDYQVVDVRFDKGLDTRTQPKLVIPGKWRGLNNLGLSEKNTPQRRDAVAAYIATGHGNGLATYRNELLTVNGGAVSTVGNRSGVNAAISVTGRYGQMGVRAEEIAVPGDQQDGFDVAVGGGVTCIVWRKVGASTVTQYCIVDNTTGATVVPTTTITAAAGATIRVVYSDDAFFLFYAFPTATGELWCSVIRSGAITTLGAAVRLINSVDFNPGDGQWDACDDPVVGGPLVMVAYGWRDGATSVRNILVSHTAGVPSVAAGPNNVITEAELPNATRTGVTVAPFDPNSLLGIFATGNTGTLAGTAGRTVAPLGIPQGAAIQIDTAVGVAATLCHVTAVAIGANIQVFRDRQADINDPGLKPIRTAVVSTAMAVVTAASTLIGSAAFRMNAAEASGPTGPWLSGKAFVDGGRTFVVVSTIETYGANGANTSTQSEQNAMFVVDGATGAVAGKGLYQDLAAVRTSTSAPTTVPLCATPLNPSGSVGVRVWAAARRSLLELFNGINDSPTGVSLVTFEARVSTGPVSVVLGESLYLAGGSTTSYTPGGVVEHGFPLYPEGISCVVSVGTGQMTAGVHRLCVIYEWTDAAGQRHQSAPSPIVSVTTALNDSVTVLVPTLLVSQKAGVSIVVFQTAAGGTTFFRSIAAANNTAAHVVSISVVSSDTVAGGNPLLYTQPLATTPVLPNIAPGPSSFVFVHQNCIVMDQTDRPGVFLISQEYTNNIGLEFAPERAGTVPLDAGRLVAGASMDEKAILFCERKPFVVYGSPPNSTGASGSLSKPQEVPADVGCSDARSVLKMPHGVIFKSEKGWYLLGRDLAARFIGDGVAAYDSQAVRSAVILEDRQECRFVCEEVTLVYTYDLQDPDGTGQWSTFTFAGATSAYAPRDAAWWPALPGYMSISLTDGLNFDFPGVIFDQPGAQGPAFITTRAQTSWLKLHGLNGFQRVRWLYLTSTAPARPVSTLAIAVDYDDSDNQTAPESYTATIALGTAFPTLTAGMTVDLRTKLRRQKCKTVAFTFTETGAAGDACLSGMQALSLEIGLKRGTNKLKAAQSVG